MKLRTEIERQPLKRLIEPKDGVLLVGSCFTDHIGQWMEEMWLPAWSNPVGVLFNPASIAQAIGRWQQGIDTPIELHEREGKYFSFEHHGRFSSADPEQVRYQIMAAERRAVEAYKRATHLVLTWGTAWVYERQGRVVANCHKWPASEFVRRRLTVDEIVSMWQPIIAAAEGKHLVLTVSPIRHVKDGLHGNEVSKATLLLAIEKLQEIYPDRVEYLPVYELFVDDLRDYRFYADDLVHPSEMGVQIVKELVSELCFGADMKAYVHQATPLVKALQHRPSDPDAESYRQFLLEKEKQRDALILGTLDGFGIRH